MAFAAGDYRFTVAGNFDNGETFLNRWAVSGVGDSSDRVNAGGRIQDFYDAAFLAHFSSHTQAVALQSKSLFDDNVIDELWTPVVGDDLANLLPTQVAVRVSLNSQTGVNGGPFLAGLSKNAVDENGDLVAGDQTILIDALNDLAAGLVTDGMRLCIERPTAAECVVAARGRVGLRLDVIRKRANDRMESYAVADLTP